MTSAISAAVVADYRMSGTAELLVVSASGEVRGYIPTPPSSGLAGGLEPLSTNKRKQQVRKKSFRTCLSWGLFERWRERDGMINSAAPRSQSTKGSRIIRGVVWFPQALGCMPKDPRANRTGGIPPEALHAPFQRSRYICSSSIEKYFLCA